MIEIEHDGTKVAASYEYKESVVEVFHPDFGRKRVHCEFAVAASTALLREMVSGK